MPSSLRPVYSSESSSSSLRITVGRGRRAPAPARPSRTRPNTAPGRRRGRTRWARVAGRRLRGGRRRWRRRARRMRRPGRRRCRTRSRVGGAVVEERVERTLEAAGLFEVDLERGQRGVDGAVEDERAHLVGEELGVERAEVGAVREPHVGELLVADGLANAVHVAHRVLARDVRQQVAVRSSHGCGELPRRRSRGRRAPRASRASSRSREHAVEALARTRSGSSRQYHAGRSRRCRSAHAARRGRRCRCPRTNSTPDAPGPPGFTSSEPMRSSGSVAGTRITRDLDRVAVGIVVVERDGERGALATRALPPVDGGDTGLARSGWSSFRPRACFRSPDSCGSSLQPTTAAPKARTSVSASRRRGESMGADPMGRADRIKRRPVRRRARRRTVPCRSARARSAPVSTEAIVTPRSRSFTAPSTVRSTSMPPSSAFSRASPARTPTVDGSRADVVARVPDQRDPLRQLVLGHDPDRQPPGAELGDAAGCRFVRAAAEPHRDAAGLERPRLAPDLVRTTRSATRTTPAAPRSRGPGRHARCRRAVPCRPWNGTPMASNSSGCQPVPTPRSRRPRLSTSSVAAVFAISTAGRSGAMSTPVASRTRSGRARDRRQRGQRLEPRFLRARTGTCRTDSGRSAAPSPRDRGAPARRPRRRRSARAMSSTPARSSPNSRLRPEIVTETFNMLPPSTGGS